MLKLLSRTTKAGTPPPPRNAMIVAPETMGGSGQEGSTILALTGAHSSLATA